MKISDFKIFLNFNVKRKLTLPSLLLEAIQEVMGNETQFQEYCKTESRIICS